MTIDVTESRRVTSVASVASEARVFARLRQFSMVMLVTLAIGLTGCENISLGDKLPDLADDAPLSQAVADALARTPELSQFRIAVKALDARTVRLSGRVDNDAQKATAEQVAARVDGVGNVVNTIYLLD